MTEEYVFEAERRDLAMVSREMFNRKNTNIAGGNISVKITASHNIDFGRVHIKKYHDYIIMTPTFMSEAWYGKLDGAQILVVDLETGQQIDGVGRLTREINMHLEAYAANPAITVVYHSHAEESMFWATIGQDMPNVTEITAVNQSLGKIHCLPYEPACSKALADQVHTSLVDLGDAALENIFLLNSHGVLITCTDLHAATRILETVEWNAKIAYQQTVFKSLGLLKKYQSCGKNTDAFLN
ncbi:sugar aldolase [Lactobacillus sp. CBA3606]|uniref:class II aldolase/adducin family protein n=1 Tax=Lactobacillus sp. CBA3606 TaxID=2099789 RepID=UPI000CFCF6AC|nr:class II aldolase/adducin family protein [Lactobacillus sp. CBA3606]AVK64037.1 sugar aldolase [Lactobacillus sp. CBA3606]